MKKFSLRGCLEKLEWENGFFNLNSSIVRLADDAPRLNMQSFADFDRIQAKIPTQRIDWLEGLQQSGFQLVEGEVDLVLSIDRQSDTSPLVVATPGDIALLREIAMRVFTQSRFRAPWYQPEDSGRFYAQWVENAVRGTFDNQCLMLKKNDAIQGFVSLRKLNQHQARIGLLAGPGAGQVLMDGALAWCQQHGLNRLYVATQLSNTAALRRYIQSGATVESSAFWLYR